MKNMVKLTGLQDEQVYVNKKFIVSLVEIEREVDGILTPITKVNLVSGDVSMVKEWPAEIVGDYDPQGI